MQGSILGAALILGAAGVVQAAATVIGFDDASDSTVINTRYPGVTFSNPVTTTAGGNVYARDGVGFAPSPANVVSVFATGYPQFDARYGAVDARFSTPMRTVSIDARPVAPFEFLTPLTKRPFLQAFDASSNLLGTVYYAGALPTGVAEVGPTETLSFTSPAGANIVTARFSTQNPAGGTPTYGFFDNLRYDRGIYTLTLSVAGGGTATASPAQAEYAYGSVVTLQAAFSPGWTFTGWSGGATGTVNPLSVTVTGDTAITARFSSLVNAIVMDDSEARIVGRGWSNLVDATCYRESCVATLAAGNAHVYALYELGVTVPGHYDVYAWYPKTLGFGARSARHVIGYDGGDWVADVDQSTGGGRWVLLAEGLQFTPGALATVRIFSPEAEIGRYLVADAVRLVWSTQQPSPPIVAACTVGDGCATISWSSVPGWTYRVRYRSALTLHPWAELTGDVTATGWTASKQDCPMLRVSQRFYQVMRVGY